MNVFSGAVALVLRTPDSLSEGSLASDNDLMDEEDDEEEEEEEEDDDEEDEEDEDEYDKDSEAGSQAEGAHDTLDGFDFDVEQFGENGEDPKVRSCAMPALSESACEPTIRAAISRSRSHAVPIRVRVQKISHSRSPPC